MPADIDVKRGVLGVLCHSMLIDERGLCIDLISYRAMDVNRKRRKLTGFPFKKL